MQGIKTEERSAVYLKMGDSMAQFSAQPRLMTSVAFRVRLGSFLKKSFRMLMMAGTLEEPPVTSTEAMSSRLIFASSSACKITPEVLSIMCTPMVNMIVIAVAGVFLLKLLSAYQ